MVFFLPFCLIIFYVAYLNGGIIQGVVLMVSIRCGFSFTGFHMELFKISLLRSQFFT